MGGGGVCRGPVCGFPLLPFFLLEGSVEIRRAKNRIRLPRFGKRIRSEADESSACVCVCVSVSVCGFCGGARVGVFVGGVFVTRNALNDNSRGKIREEINIA